MNQHQWQNTSTVSASAGNSWTRLVPYYSEAISSSWFTWPSSERTPRTCVLQEGTREYQFPCMLRAQVDFFAGLGNRKMESGEERGGRKANPIKNRRRSCCRFRTSPAQTASCACCPAGKYHVRRGSLDSWMAFWRHNVSTLKPLSPILGPRRADSKFTRCSPICPHFDCSYKCT